MQQNTCFIIHGAHITENLQHHKTNDVRRILEEKGFKESPDEEVDASRHFYLDGNRAASPKQTIVVFDDGGFVAGEAGVSFSE